MNKIAVLIPCYNESQTIAKVIGDFKKVLPKADIYVYDNNSTDETNKIAAKAKAIVRKEYQQGKGNVVRSMFNDIDADVYVMVDGDDTYPAEEVDKLINPVLEGKADMVIGDRLSSTYYAENKRPFHNFGNNLVRNLVNFLFKSHINDIMTGYRAFSKKFVDSMPVMSNGFEIETEMTVFSLVYGMNIVEVHITYRDRPEGSESKLNTFKDGFKVLLTLFNLFKDNRPFLLFGTLSVIFFAISIISGIPIINDLINNQVIISLSNIVISSLLFLIALLLFTIGIILDTVNNKTKFIYKALLKKHKK